MTLTPSDQAFIEKREKRARAWPWLGSSALVMVAGYAAWLWVKTPQLIDFRWVVAQLEAGTLAESTLLVMAGMLPIVMSAFLVFAFLVVLLWFLPFRNERRLILMVRELEAAAVRR